MRGRPLMRLCLAVCLLIALGVILYGEGPPSALTRPAQEEAQITLTGTLYQKELREDFQILYLKDNSFIYQERSCQEPKILIYDDSNTQVKIGSTVKVQGKVSLYEGPRNPGNFNQKLYYKRQGICACMWAKKVTVVRAAGGGLREALFAFRMQWKEQICQALGEKDGAILSAMLLGDKTGMDSEVRDLYQANGIGHILAISGLHLSILGLGLYRLIRRLSGSYPVGALFGILFLGLYVLMIGCTVSVLRSFVMFLFRVGADLSGRHYDGPTALSFAAVVVLLWRPLILSDGGFYLSFGSVLAAYTLLRLFKGLKGQALWMSLSIQMMTLPVLLYFFFEVPTYAIFLNLLVIPLMSGVLLCGLLGSALSLLFAPLGWGILQLCGGLFSVYETLCTGALQLPFARLVLGQPQLWQVGVYYGALAAGLLFFAYRRKEEKPGRHSLYSWLIFGVILLPGLLLLCHRGQADGLTITMLDVGQGDGIFFQDEDGGTYFVDGGSSDVKQVGKYRIEPYLKSRGVDHLDYVFLSHGDMDHICGIKEMLGRQEIGIRISCVVLPPKDTWEEELYAVAFEALNHGTRLAEIKAGQQVEHETLTLTCLWPEEEGYTTGTNENSMVLKLDYGEFDMLFTGDLGEEEEKQLSLDTVDVLKVAHHGSKNSSGAAFLAAVRPKAALISAGEHNTYGHPHEETLQRLEDAGSKSYCTKECGALTVRVEEGGNRFSVERWLVGDVGFLKKSTSPTDF